jgi:beta-lactamase class A
MICLSDNSATNTLIDLVGMENINKSMRNLGFENTVVQRKMIDQQASLRNQENLSTPAEAARIIKLLHDGNFINKQISEEILSILKKNPLENSEIAKGLPSGISMAFKPGGLGGVSTEWAIVYLSNKPYAIAVMENYKLATNSLNSIPLISKRVYEYFSMMKATDYGVIFD